MQKKTLNFYVSASTLGLLSVAAMSAGCGSSTTGSSSSTSSPSVSEIAEAVTSGAVNATEPGGTQALYQAEPASTFASRLAELLSPLPASSFAGSACGTLKSAYASCSTSGGTGVLSIDYSDCSFPGSATTWNGSQIFTFNTACPSTVTTAANLNNLSLTRTFGTGTTETTAAGVITAIDTTNAATSGYSGSGVTVPGEGELTAYASNFGTTGDRTLTMEGIHLTATASSDTSTELYDHTVSSSALTVTGSGTSRQITEGTVTVQHNLAKYVGNVAITTALDYSMPDCCHPASGVVTTTLTGSQTGTETLTFTGGTTGTCGTATLVNSAGVSSSISLSHCF